MLNLKLKNVPVQQVIQQIEDQTNFFFLYQDEILEGQRVTIEAQDATLESILEQVAQQAGINYEISDRQIILKGQNESNRSSAVSQQTKTITGVVTGANGEPIPGATVVVKGTTNGTITDFDGKYSISNVPADGILQISFVGMQIQEISTVGLTQVNVTLEEETIGLEEVVAIGYGTAKRKDITGSVASVKGEQIAAVPVANVAQAMQGRLAGVNVISQDGRPGATMSVRIRGGNSITQSSEPLYVVDGIQVSNINDIPADNIESIDVLKDAASTAIYGARGANGVILVTTKSAKAGKTTVKYNAYYQIKTNPKTLDVLDAYDYVLWNWSYATAYGSSYGDGVAQYFGLGSSYGNHLDEYKNVSSHNYINDIMRTAMPFNHDLSISSGTEKTKLFASINYMDDEGIRINSGYSRWNANLKVEQKISDKLIFAEDIRYLETETDGAKFDKATSAYQYRPIDNPLGDPTYTTGLGQGESYVDEYYNVVDVVNNYQNIAKKQNFRSNSSLTWNALKGLTLKTELSLSRNYSQTEEWDNGLETGYKIAELTKKDGFAVRWASTANYEVQGMNSDHNLSFLVGNEILNSNSDETYIKGAGYASGFTMDDAFGQINLTNVGYAANIDEFSNTMGTASRSVSFFGRANYSYLDRYLFTGTFRADASSKFASNHHWAYFPAGAFAWRISEEPFMDSTRNFLDNLKLRLSFGTSGADNINSDLWKETWTTEQITVDGNTITTYVPGEVLANPDLKWETTLSRNTGIDFGFFNNKVNGSLDAYWNTTKDILMKVPVDPTSGYEYQFQNVAQTSNKGIELAINIDLVRTNDFNLNVTASYNYNHNNIDKLSDEALADTHTGWGSSMRLPYYDYIIREGKPVGVIQGFKAEGFYTVDDFNYTNGVYTLKDGIPDIETIINYPANLTSGFSLADGQIAFPGAVKFKDVTGDGIVNSDDATEIGNTMPKHTGGFSFNASYKNLDFSAAFTYQIGGNIYNANAMYSMMGNKDNSLGANRLAFVKDTYKVYDIDSNGDLYLVTDPDALNELNKNAKYALNYSEYGICSSEFIEDASYLRLQNLTIGYTLPKSMTGKVGIQNLRLYFTGTNLFCLTGYSGLDPDVNTDTDGVNGFPTPNYDYNPYPKARTYTFGMNLTF
ncbi:TonB-dependent receptor [Mangrovibacterium diazotrophicum]|nr:TonB-dependent receptor [Mangrovibacterium diazotrophicum]